MLLEERDFSWIFFLVPQALFVLVLWSPNIISGCVGKCTTNLPSELLCTVSMKCLSHSFSFLVRWIVSGIASCCKNVLTVDAIECSLLCSMLMSYRTWSQLLLLPESISVVCFAVLVDCRVDSLACQLAISKTILPQLAGRFFLFIICGIC